MPELGGSTTQLGILYQNSVAALYLGRLLDAFDRPQQDRVIHVRIEAPAEVDDTVVTFADLHRAYIQSKEHLRVNSSEWKTLWSHFDKQFRAEEFQSGQDRLTLYVGFGLQDHYELRGLCERAATSPSIVEWQSRLSQVQESLLKKIVPHFSSMGTTTAYYQEILRHVDVHILPLDAIEADRLRDWMPHCNRTPSELFRLLRDRIGGAARVRGSFEAHYLRRSLLAEALNLQFDTPVDIIILQQSIRKCGSLLRHHQHTFASTNIHIGQTIVGTIVGWLLEESDAQKNLAVMLDQAGMGKTVVMRDVLTELERLGVDVLAIKADLQLTETTGLDQIQGKLALPSPVEQIVSRLAQLGRVAILIDQIDALSLSLAHDQQAINVVLDLIARLRQIPNVRILLSCRSFDYNTDPRLKTIDLDTRFTLSKLPESQIREVLTILNVNYDQMTTATKELLTTPLHLDLFARATSTNVDVGQLHGISSVQELYALVWQNVVCKQELGSPPIFERVQVIDRLTEHMDQLQRTVVPHSIFETAETMHLGRAINWLASSGLIVRGKTDWAFLHQTFFDYSYARRFVEGGGDIATHTLASSQGVFERPKLLQIVAYLRGYDNARNINCLNRLFTAPDLRFHLYSLLLGWFGALPNPRDDEWLLATKLFLSTSKYPQFLTAVHGNAGWFEHLQTLTPRWLADSARLPYMLAYLESIVDKDQAKVILVVEPFLGKSEQWNAQIGGLLSRIRNWNTEEAVKLYEGVILKSKTLNRMDLWSLGQVCDQSPAVGCRLLRHIFELSFQSYVDSSTFTMLLVEGLQNLEGSIEEALKTVSAKTPAQFLEAMLPWVEKVVTQKDDKKDENWFTSDALSHDGYSDIYRLQAAFARVVVNSLIHVAQTDPEAFRKFARQLAALPYDTPQQMLARTYCAVHDLYAEDIYTYFIEDHRRLNLGSQQYDSRELLHAVYAHLSDEQRTRLLARILDYAPIHKYGGLDALRRRGFDQYRLLAAIPIELLEDLGQLRLREWRRKFPDIDIAAKPDGITGGTVGSPIKMELAAKMSTQNWLQAMSKYQKGVEHKDILKGGAGELSRVLTELIKSTPDRYHSLFVQAPPDIDEPYVIAFASGFSESKAPANWTFEVFRRYANRAGRELKTGLARAVEKLAKRDVPDDIIEKLAEWVRSPMGEDELWWSKGDNHGDVYGSYLTSDRGAAFEAIMRIMDAKASEEARKWKWDLMGFVASDPSTALRIGAIHELTYMIQHDRAISWQLFVRLMAGHESLLETRYVREFLYWSLYKNFKNAQGFIEQMMLHSKPDVQQMGSELACLAAISDNSMESSEALADAHNLAEKAITGQPAMRKGAVRIYGANMVHGAEHLTRSLCMQKVRRLINDEDSDVRDAINSIFSDLKENNFLELREFMDDYVLAERHSLAYQFAKYLWKCGMLDPEWTLSAIQIAASKPTEEQWHSGMEEFMRFTLLAYTSHEAKSPTRENALNVFDTLMQQYSGVANKILDEWDRR